MGLFDEFGNILAESQADTSLENLKVKTVELKKKIIFLIKEILASSKVSPQDIKTISTSGHGNGIYIITDDLNVELNHDNKRGVSELALLFIFDKFDNGKISREIHKTTSMESSN